MQGYLLFYFFLKRIALLGFVFCLCISKLHAQVEFFKNESPSSIPAGSQFYIDSSFDHSIEHYRVIKSRLQPLLQNEANLSYKNQMLWVKIPLLSLADMPLQYLMIRNPHINYVGAWLMKGDSVQFPFPLTGDHLPFSTRSIHHADFVYELPFQRDDLSVLLLLDKRNELLNVPVHFLTGEGFITYNRNKNLFAGLVAGLSLFLFLFNIFLFIQMRERLYVFYGLYIFMGLFYIFSDYGYSFMYLFPNMPGLGDFSRPVALSLGMPLYFLFCMELLRTKQNFSLLYGWLRSFFFAYLALFLISIPLMPKLGQLRIGLQVLMQLLQLLIMIGILLVASLGYRKKQAYSFYIILSTSILLVAGTFFALYLAGIITDNFFTRNLMNIGFGGEITILAFVLSLRFKNYKEEVEHLIREKSHQQEQIFKTVTDYQEKELQRLSSLLHDSVGAQLSALRLNLESIPSRNEKIDDAITGINDLANEVRTFSHSLSPVLLQKKGLKNALQQLIDQINASAKLYIQFESLGSVERTYFRYELLIYNIVQELLQNIMKHSEASEAIVQLILENNFVSIFVEDNGKGCKQNEIKDGLGFTQIKQLVTFVKGSLQIKTEEGKGCQVSIEFTLLPDERNIPHSHS